MDFSTAFAAGLASGQQRLQNQEALEMNRIRLALLLKQYETEAPKLLAETQAKQLEIKLRNDAMNYYNNQGAGAGPVGPVGSFPQPPTSQNAPLPPRIAPSSSPTAGRGTQGLPQNTADLLDYWGRYNGLTPEQIAVLPKIVSAESGGNPWAHNKANANGTDDFGIMQVNSGNLGMLQPGENIFDPSVNTRIGTQIFSNALQQSGGGIPGALGAYNTGRVNPNAPYVNRVLGQPPVHVAQNDTGVMSDAAGPPQRGPVQGMTSADLLSPEYIAKLTSAAMNPNPYISKPAKDALAVVESVRKAQAPVKMDGMQWFQSRYGRDPGTDQEWALVKKYNQDNSTQSVNVNMPPEADETAKQQGKTLNEERTKINNEGSAAIKTLAALHYAEPLVNASGSLADMRKAVGGLLSLSGADPNGVFAKQIQEAQDINTLQALAARMMLPVVQGTAGFHSNFSNTDLQTVMSMNVSPQNLPEVNRRLIALAREEAQLALEKQKHFKGLKDYADYENRLADWNEKIAARYPANPPASASPDAGTGNTGGQAGQYKTPDDVKADYKAGKLTKDQAAAILQNTFGME